jgi:hypothetical protein
LQKLGSECDEIVTAAAPFVARAAELTAAVALAQTQVSTQHARASARRRDSCV